MSELIHRIKLIRLRCRSLSPIKRRKMIGIRVSVLLAFTVFLCTGFNYILYKKTAPDIMPIAVSQCVSEINKIGNECIMVSLEKNGSDYTDYCSLSFAADGTVNAIRIDSVKVSALKSDIVGSFKKRLEKLKRGKFKIPLGNIISEKYFGGRGFDVTVRSVAFTSLSASLNSEITDAGINQCLHRIILELKVELTLVCMGQKSREELTLQSCIAESLIVGDIPSVFS